jgi:hypothetical protein
MTERGYSLERHGSVQDLSKHGFTLETALGQRFTFYMDDGDEQGRPDDIMFVGSVVLDPKYGYLAELDGDDFFWRSQLEG